MKKDHIRDGYGELLKGFIVGNKVRKGCSEWFVRVNDSEVELHWEKILVNNFANCETIQNLKPGLEVTFVVYKDDDRDGPLAFDVRESSEAYLNIGVIQNSVISDSFSVLTGLEEASQVERECDSHEIFRGVYTLTAEDLGVSEGAFQGLVNLFPKKHEVPGDFHVALEALLWHVFHFGVRSSKR